MELDMNWNRKWQWICIIFTRESNHIIQSTMYYQFFYTHVCRETRNHHFCTWYSFLQSECSVQVSSTWLLQPCPLPLWNHWVKMRLGRQSSPLLRRNIIALRLEMKVNFKYLNIPLSLSYIITKSKRQMYAARLGPGYRLGQVTAWIWN